MLTIFSIPKPFDGPISVIQRNAIQSWQKLGPDIEVLLFGDEVGVAETAHEFNTHHIPDIQKNEFGTPLLSSAFKMAEQISSKDLLCFVNADIVLLSSFFRAIQKVNYPRFLMIGQRWNLDITDPIEFSDNQWERSFIEFIKEKGTLQPPFGSDYFIFPKAMDWNMPDFAVGRPGWDNWMIYQARLHQVPVIDATTAGTVVHQNHNYAHIPNGQNKATFEGPEAQINRSLMVENSHSFGVDDSTLFISEKGVVKASEYKYLRHRVPHQHDLNPTAGEITKYSWRIMQSIIYRKRLFPNRLMESMIYSLTK